jgi:hypothetical protein
VLAGITRSVLHILTPGLLERVGQWSRDYGDLPRAVGIEALIARALRQPVQARGMDATLCFLFGLTSTADRDLPLGALRRHGFHDDADTGFWLCADPVHLSADAARVVLRDGDSLGITQAESKRLIALLSDHFADQGWRLEIGSPAQWHLRLPEAVKIRTWPTRAVMGKAIEAYLPAGEQGAAWRAVLNEIQMLFFAADVNLARHSRRQPSLNGLWVSGAGTLPTSDDLHTTCTSVWADDAIASGLARLAGIDKRPVPESLEIILSGSEVGEHLLCLDAMLAPTSYDDYQAWCEALRLLDTRWFMPLRDAITSGRLNACYIYDCNGQRFDLYQSRRWRFWRRARPLHVYA